MNDEIDYATSLRERAALLEGLPADAVERAFDRVALHEGAYEVIADLRNAGVTTAILTGGFERGVAAALERTGVGVDHVVANRLPTDGDGALDGTVEGPLVEGTKDDALRAVADEFDVPMDRTVAVGDGANDLPMLEVAGVAIGYEPKAAVEPHCDVTVASMPELAGVLRAEGVL